MESAIFLGVLVLIAGVVSIPVAWVGMIRAGRLRARIDTLESQMRLLLARGVPPLEAASGVVAPAAVSPESQPAATHVQQPVVAPAVTAAAAEVVAPSSMAREPDRSAAAVAPGPADTPLSPLSPLQPLEPLAVDAVTAARAAAPVDGTAVPPAATLPPTFGPVAGPARVSWEQRFGSQIFVWIGGIALALAALFLVRLAIDHGYLSPAVRVILAALFGAGLIGGAERLRSRDARVAQALAAAGVAALFGALFSAVAMYDLIPRFPGGLLATALTAGAIGLALRHGPFVAALGFVGGALSPLFLGSDTPNVPILFGFLLAISLGTMAVIRHRGWWWLAWGVLAGGAIWSLAWLITASRRAPSYEADLVAVGLFQVAIAGAFVWATWKRINEGSVVPVHATAKIVAAATVTGLLLVGGIVGAETSPVGWACLLLHGAGIYWLARKVPRFQWLAVIPPLLSIFAFGLWRLQSLVPFGPTFVEQVKFAEAIAVVGGLIAAGALALLWNAGRPGFWAALSVATAALHFVLAYAALRHHLPDTTWGAISLGLALPFLVASERLAAWRTRMPGATEALGFVAVGVAFFVAAAIPLELRREWITMAYALTLPLVAWIAWRLDLAVLRWLMWGIAGLVTVRLALNPEILGYPLGAWPLVNWILYTYGVAAAAFWLAGRFLRPQADAALAMAIGAAARLFLLLLFTLEIRSLFHGDGLVGKPAEFLERACYVAAWGGFALWALLFDSRYPSRVGLWTWRVVGTAALVAATIFQALLLNPVFVGGDVGSTPIVNGLLLGYALPAVMAAVAAWRLSWSTDTTARNIAAIGAVFLAFVFLSTEVRHIFHPALGGEPLYAEGTELYVYSMVWLAFGAAMLGVGIWRNLAAARYAGMAVICLTIAKVFLVDMAGLDKLLRVFSFLILGAVLLALAYFYRRFVPGGREAAPATGT